MFSLSYDVEHAVAKTFELIGEITAMLQYPISSSSSSSSSDTSCSDGSASHNGRAVLSFREDCRKKNCVRWH